MKFKIISFIIVLSAVTIFIGLIIKDGIDFRVLATSYSENSTSLYNYSDKTLIETENFHVGGVEDIIYDDKENRIIYDKYGDQLMVIEKDIIKKYKVKNNPLEFINHDEEQYILHNGNLEFSISKYNTEFEKLIESEKIPGFAGNFIIYNDIIYALTNVYDENSNRTVTIYTLNKNTLRVLDLIEVKGLTFGFYIREVNGDINIYGNSNEEKKDLSIYKYQLANNKLKLLVNADIRTMWVSKVIDINKKEILLNEYSIISIDENNIPKLEFSNNQTLIDLEYNKAKKFYYLLSGDFYKNQFEVHKLNSNFDIIESKSLNLDNKKPTNLLLD